MKLDRTLINKGIGYIGFGLDQPLNYEDLCVRINRVKHALLEKGIEKDGFVVINNLSPNPDTIAILFAVAELGCHTQFMPDEVWGHVDSDGHTDGFLDPSDYSNEYGPESTRPEFRCSDMLTPIAQGFLKGDAFGGVGNKYHYAAGSFGREVILTNYSEFETYPDHDIDPPWEVTEDNLFLLQGTSGQLNYVTQKQIVDKARDCIDIFGYTGKKVAITKSQHHRNSFELCILPALMSARRIFEIPMTDSYLDTNEGIKMLTDRLRRTGTLLMKRNGVDLVWGVERGQQTESLTYLDYQGNDYMDITSRPVRINPNHEGHISPTNKTREVFRSILQLTGAESVFEIGFNQGHSSRLFLELGAKVHSVDIGYYQSTKNKMKEVAEEWSLFTYELRDSKTLFPSDYDNIGMVFIDGDHSVEGVVNDINFANDMKVPYILVDDYHPKWFSHIINLVDSVNTYKIVASYGYDAQERGGTDLIPNTMVLLKRC